MKTLRQLEDTFADFMCRYEDLTDSCDLNYRRFSTISAEYYAALAMNVAADSLRAAQKLESSDAGRAAMFRLQDDLDHAETKLEIAESERRCSDCESVKCRCNAGEYDPEDDMGETDDSYALESCFGPDNDAAAEE